MKPIGLASAEGSRTEGSQADPRETKKGIRPSTFVELQACRRLTYIFPFWKKVGDLSDKQIGARPGPTMSAWPDPGPCC